MMNNWKDKFPQKNRYFETDNGILYNVDVVEGLKRFSDESIDLVVTSPPYDNLRYYSAKNEKDLQNIWSFEKFKIIAKELYRIMTKGGIVVWVVNDATIKGSETGNSFRQVLYFKDECGFKLHDTMIYAKKNPIPLNHSRYEQFFEYMFVLTKGKPKTFNPIKVVCQYQGRKSGGTLRHTPNGTLKSKHVLGIVNKYKIKGNIWEYSVGYKNASKDKIAYKHPAIFPEQLACDHIISWSNEGDIVLDPLCGSGTTLKMAEKLNRKWVGIELEEKYCEISKERILKEGNLL